MMWGKLANPELAFDLENEANPSIIEISSNTAVSEDPPTSVQSEESPKGENVKKENAPKESSSPEKPALPVKATVSRQKEKKGPVQRRGNTCPQKDAESTLLQRKERARKRIEVTSG